MEELSKEIFKVAMRTSESKDNVYKRENLASIAIKQISACTGCPKQS